MLPIFKNPMRLICRSHLLLTTALISLAPLPFGAGAARAQMYLDNLNPGDPGPDYQTASGDWRTDSVIWNDGTGAMYALPTDQIGVLTGGLVTLDVGGPGVGNAGVWAGGLQVDSGNFTLNGGHLYSGSADGSLSFLVAVGGNLVMNTDVTAAISDTATATNINVQSTGGPSKNTGLLEFEGDTRGTINNAGNVTHSGQHTGNVVNDNYFTFTDTITGNLTNNFEADSTARANTVIVAGALSGTLTNNDLVRTGNNGGTLGGLTNNASAAVIVATGDTLVVSSAVTNGGAIYLDGGTLDADVNTTAGGRINMASTSDEATLDGNLVNAGVLDGTGTITGNLTTSGFATFGGEIQGALTNSGQFQTAGNLEAESLTNTGGALTVNINNTLEVTDLDAVTNSATLNINGTLDGRGSVANTGTINLAGTLDAGLVNGSAAALGTGTVNMSSAAATITSDVTNYGTMNVMGEINGVLTNRNTVGTTGNITVSRLVTSGPNGSTTINEGHELTSNVDAWNYASTTIAGTLNGNIFNGVDPSAPTTPAPTPGTLTLDSGTINGTVTNSGLMNASGTVTGAVRNSRTSSVLNTTGNLTLGTLESIGTTNVQAGHVLHSNGAIDNSGQMNVVGDITLGGISRLTNSDTLNINGGSITGAVTNDATLSMNSGNITGSVRNNDTMTMNGGSITGAVTNNDTLTMNGGDITGAVTNNATMNVNADTEISGSLTNSLLGDLTLNSTGGASVTLTVTNQFINYGIVDGTGTGALTIAAGTYINAGGSVTNVNVVGNLQNEAVLNYDEDSFLNGSLTNTATGDVTVSAALDMNNQNVTNRGDFLVTTDADSVGNLHSVRNLVNEAEFEIATGGTVSANLVENRLGGTMDVAGTLNSATQVNNTGATMTISGLVNADGGLNNNSSPTQTGQITMAGGTIDGVVINRANLGGNGTITGLVTNHGTMAPIGTLQVAGLDNREIVNIATSSVLHSTANVLNYDRLNVAGRLEAGLNNHASTTLSNGTILGAVTNQRGASLTGNGTITGALLNRGSATIGGRVDGLVTNDNMLTSAGTLNVAGLTNNATLDVDTGSILHSTAAVQNNGTATIEGELQAALTNAGTTELALGRITGAVTNTRTGTMTGNGTIAGTLLNAGAATIGGRVTGLVTNNGTLTSADTLRVAALNNTATLNVAGGSTLQADTNVQNSGTATIAGALRGGLVNAGSTALAGGSVDRLANNATLTGNGTVASLANAGNATIGGRVNTLTNTGTLVSSGALSVGALTNDELVRVATGSTLSMDSGNQLLNRDRLVVQGTIEGLVDNRASAVMSGGTLRGGVNNRTDATFSGSGTVTGTLSNSGLLNADGALSVGQVINNGRAEILATGRLTSENAVTNNATLRVAGTLAADLVNATTATTTLASGTVVGDVSNRGSLNGIGRIDGQLANSGIANIGGVVSNLANLAGGSLTTTANLSATDFRNDGTANVASGTTLRVTNPTQNSTTGTLTVAGRLTGSLTNDGTLRGAGEISGPVINNASGTTTWTGQMEDSFTNHGAARLSGSVAGALRNEDGGRLATIGNLSATGATGANGATGVVNASGGTMSITEGSVFSVTNGLTNEAGAGLTLTGEVVGAITNAGTMRQTGTLTGSLTTSGTADLNGTISRNLVYQGGNLTTGDAFRVGGDFRLEDDYSIAAGRQINAARTVVTTGTTLDLQGALQGTLLNSGTVEVRGRSASVSGQATNNGLISLSDGSGRIDTLTVGGLTGSGRYELDVNTRDAVADRIVVDGGAATGIYALQLNFLYPTEILATGNQLTLIDVDESFGSQNQFKVTHNDLPPISERIVYSVDGTNGGRDVTLVAQTNPAIGALFGNVALTQSLIGSVINRPTSPFVTALAYEDKARPCGIGSWGRITGGHANATGSTDNGVSSAEAEISADYRGVQVGTDLACFDDRFGGWNMAFGVLGGINRGDTNQPVYAIDPNNSQNLTGTLTSYTSTDFEQRYIGVYMTATRDRLQADLQYRLEKTDFTIENKPLAGYSGLGLDETDFSSDGYTLSGSLSYGIPVGDSGWAVVPTVGFAWSKMSTDSIPFGGTGVDAGYRLTFDDSTRKIGFVGATIAKTFVQPTQNAALSTFATATWYKDFADPTISVFSKDDDSSFTPQKLESDNLGAYGEISFGANWIKVLGPKSRGRQISAGARIDARYGDQLDSVGVSGQFRWQF